MLRLLATILLLSLTLSVSASSSNWYQQEQNPKSLKTTPGQDGQERPDGNQNLEEVEDQDIEDDYEEPEEEIVEPESVEENESVNKYNFIFYFLYKFKYEDAGDHGILSSIF